MVFNRICVVLDKFPTLSCKGMLKYTGRPGIANAIFFSYIVVIIEICVVAAEGI